MHFARYSRPPTVVPVFLQEPSPRPLAEELVKHSFREHSKLPGYADWKPAGVASSRADAVRDREVLNAMEPNVVHPSTMASRVVDPDSKTLFGWRLVGHPKVCHA